MRCLSFPILSFSSVGCALHQSPNASVGFNEAVGAVQELFSEERLKEKSHVLHPPQIKMQKEGRLFTLEYVLFSHKYARKEKVVMLVKQTGKGGCYIGIEVYEFSGKSISRYRGKEKEYYDMIVQLAS